MKIRYIFNYIYCYLISGYKKRSSNDLDAKYWIQNILLKSHLKSLNKNN